MSRRPFPVATRRRRQPRRRPRRDLGALQVANRAFLIPLVIVVAAGLVALGLFPLFGATGQALTRFDDLFLGQQDQNIDIPAFPERSTIYAADGSVLATVASENRVYVPLKDVNETTRNAVLAIEDDGFYKHGGVDVLSIMRAALANLRARKVVQGGSTISQQVIKNTETGNAQTLARKIQEAQEAIRLEREHTKDWIFEKYLNLVYFGHGAYGIAAAAEYYFATPIEKLNLAQSALLAGLISSPAKWDPIEHEADAVARRNEVLVRMLKLGWITEGRYRKASRRPIKLSSKMRDVNTFGPQPYFSRYVQDSIIHPIKTDPNYRRILKIFGKTWEDRRDALLRGGYRIFTTLRPDMQQQAAESVEGHLKNQGAKPPKDPEAAVITIDPRSGAIQAMYGGANFAQKQFNLATQEERTAGSSFKAFTLASAFEQGFPVGKVYDSTSPVKVPSDKCFDPTGVWSPANAEGGLSGPINMSEATADSINVYFAQLIADVGPANVAETARRMGVQPYAYNASVYIPDACAITLGAVGVNPLSMTSGYSTLANDGVHCYPYAIRKIESANGKVVFKSKPACDQVLDPKIAAQVTSLLTGVVTHGTGTAAQLINRPVAGKTGTGQDYQDAWFLGYIPQMVTGVWVGYTKSEIPMLALPVLGGRNAFGGTIAAPIWHDYMQRAVAGLPVKQFPVPPPPKRGTVPDVVGMKEAEAEQALKDANFTALSQDGPCVDPKGIVCAQSPAAGASLELGSAVTITVSNGTVPKVKVPNVVGLKKEKAVATLQAAGFDHVVQRVEVQDPVLDNVVLSQDPPGGVKRKAGTKVSIVVGTFSGPTPNPTPKPSPGGGQPGRSPGAPDGTPPSVSPPSGETRVIRRALWD